MPTYSSRAKSFRCPMLSRRCAAPSSGNASNRGGWRRSLIARDLRLALTLNGDCTRSLEEPLLLRSFAQCPVSVGVGRHPAPQPFRLEYGTMSHVVITHREQGLSEPPFQLLVEIGPGGE